MYILWILDTEGTLRFGELRRKVNGISTKVLTERLRKLEALDIVHRNYVPTIPPEVTYHLTDRGRELSRTLDPLSAIWLHVGTARKNNTLQTS